LAPAFSSFFLNFLGFFLVHAFLDRLRSAFDEVLGFLQAEGPVIARTSLMTSIFLSPAHPSVDRELGLGFSGSGRSAATSGGSTATGAAAETPHFSSSSFASSAASRTVSADRSSTIYRVCHFFFLTLCL
jgi:hypothetical protein